MAKIMIIGAGGVGTVVAHKVAQNHEIFQDVLLASRTLSKCDAISKSIGTKYGNKRIQTAQLNADHVQDIVNLYENFHPNLVINVALPYQDLTIMEACLSCRVNYLDTANYEPRNEAKFEYKWQWDYYEKFKKVGLTAILGCGFDPGATGVFTAYAAKHYFSEIQYLDIVDCNDGTHGKAFATNFNPEINIREVTQKGKYWENGQWIITEPQEIHKLLTFPNIGKKESYMIYHEELESLVKNFPTIKRARFWMTFSLKYLTYLSVIKDIGMANINPVLYNGMEIIPIQFLKAILPEPSKLGINYTGETSIGCRIKGLNKEGEDQTYSIYNNCQHQDAYKKTGTQAISYTTGVPAVVGAILFIKNLWRIPGVFNVEEFNPDPFMEELEKQGLSWKEKFNEDLEL